MTVPAAIATTSPSPTYKSAILMPNRPARRIRATSFTTGEAMRKPKVTPSGRPDSTKPMNIGTAEHEQNGVSPPSAASTVPRNSPFPETTFRTFRAGRSCG